MPFFYGVKFDGDEDVLYFLVGAVLGVAVRPVSVPLMRQLAAQMWRDHEAKLQAKAALKAAKHGGAPSKPKPKRTMPDYEDEDQFDEGDLLTDILYGGDMPRLIHYEDGQFFYGEEFDLNDYVLASDIEVPAGVKTLVDEDENLVGSGLKARVFYIPN